MERESNNGRGCLLGDMIKARVVLFLAEIKRLLVKRKFILIPRDINLKALANLGWNEKNLIDYLLGLTPQNYLSGPDPDRDIQEEEVWFFGDEIEEQGYYIKLKIKREPSEQVVCISFHEAEYELRYPIK